MLLEGRGKISIGRDIDGAGIHTVLGTYHHPARRGDCANDKEIVEVGEFAALDQSWQL